MDVRCEVKREALEIAEDRRLSVERELEVARDVYAHAVGMDARVKWGGKIRELQGFLIRAKESGA
jgi:hypothetical protein